MFGVIAEEGIIGGVDLDIILHTENEYKGILKGDFGGKKWRRGWELNPHDTVLQTAPLAIRAPRLDYLVIYSPFSEKQAHLSKKSFFSVFLPIPFLSPLNRIDKNNILLYIAAVAGD